MDEQKERIRRIFEFVEYWHGVSEEEILGRRRCQLIVYARHLAIYIFRADLGMSFPQIKKRLRIHQHSSVIYAYRKMRALAERDLKIRAELRMIRSQYQDPD